MMKKLILVRHGQSLWNLEKRFTGWVDVDLTDNGKLEAKKSGELIKKEQLNIDLYYCSFQLRAKNTLKIIQDELNDHKEVKEAWQLNERHYGALTGLNKDEMKIKLGEEKVHQFRRSWDLRPDPLEKTNPFHPLNIETYKEIPTDKIPNTESLKDTYERVIEFYKNEVENNKDKNILISAHGNSIRALCKYLFILDNTQITHTSTFGVTLDNNSTATYDELSTINTATTAAIDARIIDLVDDVGGFVPIASETAFPSANPDVNNGAGTLVSIKAIGSTRTPSGGTVTISNGAGSSTVTITGCGSTVLTAGFGVIVETTSTLHTYAFHRLVPKATEVSTVAANATNIAAIFAANLKTASLILFFSDTLPLNVALKKIKSLSKSQDL